VRELESKRFHGWFDENFESIQPEGMDEYIKVQQILHVEEGDDNIWDANIEFTLYANEYGIGFHHRIPAGYSEYTYDPDDTYKFYLTNDFEAFMNLGLTQDQREFVTESRKIRVLNALKEIWLKDEKTEE
jgi:hypothetical protein